MREFGKIKTLLDTAELDEDEWDRTRGSCELLGGRLQQIRDTWQLFSLILHSGTPIRTV